jgi:acetyl-CoA C-acetyltransferase
MAAARYIDVHGVTPEQLASVSVKNHAHGTGNKRAQHGRHVTVEEVLASKMIADPLTLLQCCAITDAAAAAVIGSRKRQSRDIAVLGDAFATGGLWNHETEHAWGYQLARDTARAAYDSSGMGPSEMDLIELHDAFTIGELVTSEALGLAPEGEGASLVTDGHSWLGGRQPINPSGGLLSRGHPLGATGVAQVVEVVWQLRGDADGRQVEGARTGLVETLGGGASGLDGNACVVSILGKR